ncbi:hypothetical protein Pan97_36590 [Bremerella volcania]|uniref:Uncharacterized protein n=1 Tax=Bremerella volcania TaxID=2527984 RepID=A0A518CBK5_9BACT|nr:hypothetical protein Pan97_36590 [Bremerella volcania]
MLGYPRKDTKKGPAGSLRENARPFSSSAAIEFKCAATPARMGIITHRRRV